ncbi:MAG: nucleoside triphosphate pyrophosphohydrolase [Pseudomonadota bacterium]
MTQTPLKTHHFKIDKLIRDKLPEIIKAKGARIEARIMEQDEYIKRLKDKLIEESLEVSDATTEDMIEELADVFEVLHALREALNLSFSQIEQKRLSKKDSNGGFKKKLYASHVEIDADHEDIDYYLSQKEKYVEIK